MDKYGFFGFSLFPLSFWSFILAGQKYIRVSASSLGSRHINKIKYSTDCHSSIQFPDEKSSTEDGEDCEMESEEGEPIYGEEEDDGDDEDDEDDDECDENDEADNAFLNEMVEGPASSSGCTAVVALLVERDLYVANAGDSRCVVCRNGEALEMSIDHKPEDNDELERIQNAGGRVTMDGRVNGGLNLSRAIGDHAYKMVRDSCIIIDDTALLKCKYGFFFAFYLECRIET